MYTALLRLLIEISQQNLILYVGLLVLLMASWGLVVAAIVDLVIRVFDIRT